MGSEMMIVIEEIDTIPLGIAEASAIVADTTMIVVITEVMVSVVIEAMIEEITVVEVVLIAIAEMEEVLIAIAEMEAVMIAIAEMEAVMIVIVEMVAVMIVIAEMEEDITGETAVVMIAEMIVEVDITVIEDLQNVMVMIPQRRDQGYNCKNALLPWNPHPHLPVLLFLVAQNQLTPRKKNEKLKKNCKNNKKT